VKECTFAGTQLKRRERMYYETDEEIKKNYMPDSLEDMIMTGMREMVKISEYIEKCYKQMEIVRNTEFLKLVIIDKNPWAKPVEYDVVLHCIPLIKGADMIYDKSHYRKFIGNAEKKEAMVYAEDLAKRHKAKIIMKNINENIPMSLKEEKKCTT
jgi:hypothetical protein